MKIIIFSEKSNGESHLVRTASNENGTGNAAENISARVGSLLGSLRNSGSGLVHQNRTNNQSSQDNTGQNN